MHLTEGQTCFENASYYYCYYYYYYCYYHYQYYQTTVDYGSQGVCRRGLMDNA